MAGEVLKDQHKLAHKRSKAKLDMNCGLCVLLGSKSKPERTDWRRVAAMTKKEIVAAAKSDSDAPS